MIPDTPEGIILEAVIEGMAAYYSEQLSQNVRRGMLASAVKAQSTGGNRPLGYKTGPDKKFVIDPETAPTVRLVYELYAQGKTVSEIVKLLNEKGLRTRKGKPLTVNSIRAVLKNKKYIGIYHYNGKEYPEAYIPALVDVETFDKVQRLLVQNKRAPARKWTKAEYLLTGKMFCGLCGHTMVGESGTGKSGAKYYYYNCLEKKKNRTCHKRAVHKDWIEKLVLEKAKAIVMSDEMIDFISEKTYRYYIDQNTDTSYTDSLHAELEQVKTATANLVRAVEAGIFNAATKARMDELDQQQRELETALADAELVNGLRLTQDHIKFFLLQFRQLDFDEPDSQHRIIDIFVNAVFVYDDRVTITFNYSGDNRTITLPEVDAAAEGVRGLGATGHQKSSGAKLSANLIIRGGGAGSGDAPDEKGWAVALWNGSHIGADAGSGLVHTIKVTAANKHGITAASKPIREDGKVVYDDSGYLEIQEFRNGRKYRRTPVLHPSTIGSTAVPSSPPKMSDRAVDWERYIESRKSSVRCPALFSNSLKLFRTTGMAGGFLCTKKAAHTGGWNEACRSGFRSLWSGVPVSQQLPPVKREREKGKIF